MSKAKKNFVLPKTLVLNYKNWRCGDSEGLQDRGFAHGTGPTELLNYNGYKCCLGQFCSQAGVPSNRLSRTPQPSELWDNKNGEVIEVEGLSLSLEQKAISINDDGTTTIAEKVAALKKLFKKHGYTIKTKNFPAGVLK